MKRFALLLFIAFYFNSFSQDCQSFKRNNSHKNHEESFSLRASNQRSDTINILKYTINLSITDFTNKIISGNTQIKFTPKINGVNTLSLDLLELTVDSVKHNSSILTYNYNDTLLKINLPATYNISDTQSIIVYYHGTPQMDASGWGGFYFQNGFAFNLGVGFDANPHVYGRVWFPCFDNFVERSKYEFNITTNAGRIAYCNGYLAHDTTDASGYRTRKWIMNEEIPTYLACVAVANYAEIKQTYNGINGVIPIVIAALAADTTAVKNSFVNLNTALSTFENHFGPYHWNKVGYYMVPFGSGAMEHATGITYPKSFATGSTTYQTLMAHELSHHWFGDLATCRTQEDMWLNEGWASYCEDIFTEALSGYNAYLTSIRNNHNTQLQFAHNKEGYLTLSNIPHAYTYGDHVYKKGALIAHTLRGYMGDSLFFSSLKTYLSQNMYKDVSSLDFQNGLSAASGINMSDFFDGWVNQPGWPHFSVDSFVVQPNAGNFDVTVFVKQKLSGATNYLNNVPLEVTFKSATWVEQIKKINLSGQTGNFTFTLPFNPAFVAINMGEKLSHAVAPEYKTIKTIGNHNFVNAKANMNVSSISDSAFIRVEHNFATPDSYKKCCIPYKLSPNHYWKIDGIIPNNFKAKVTLNYDGRTNGFTGNYWLDNLLFTSGKNEDSLVLMYRQSPANEWAVYPYYTKNTISSVTDKRGTITIDSFQLGEYTFAMNDYVLGITNQDTNVNYQIKLFPNPASNHITVDLSELKQLNKNIVLINVSDITGRIIDRYFVNSNTININTENYSNGMYFIMIGDNNTVFTKEKFIINK